MEKINKLDGKWESAITLVHDVFKVIIKGNAYVSFCNNYRYGKGKIIYDNENFTLTSTHAYGPIFFRIPWLFFWLPFVEVVKGKFISVNDNTLTVSGIEGRYSDYNGTWVHLK
jgi:hypothetical protein